VPLIGVPTLQRLMAAAGDRQMALLTGTWPTPPAGRILRDAAGKVTRIVEERRPRRAPRHGK
jgi:bifunctional UDP-N-acetylglucosamine pyrophosphorylase/glucosamine-1-phosphate N-acetyltransferase